MSSNTVRTAIAAAIFALTAAAGGTAANALETCVNATSTGGPYLIEGRAFGKAESRLRSAARATEAKIRQAHAANGFNAGATTYGRVAINCFRPNPLQFRVKCEGVQRVCVAYTKIRNCPSNQYYSAAARSCVTLR